MYKPILLSLLLIAPAFGPTMYKCPNAAGVVNFQQMPCTPQGGGEIVPVKAIPTGADSGSGSPQGASETDRVKQLAHQAERERRFLEIRREIDELERKTRDYRKDMANEMSSLKNKKQFSTNSLAGAVWEQSISDEMNAVSSKYDSLIRSAQSQIDSLRQEETQLRKEKQVP